MGPRTEAERERLLWESATSCRWCTRLIVPCLASRCRGPWRYGYCGGWMHADAFHMCEDGKQQAQPEEDFRAK